MGYKQVDVARLLGIQSTNRISRWERGLAMPSALNLIKLSILYRTLVKQLYADLGEDIKRELLAKETELRDDTDNDHLKYLY